MLGTPLTQVGKELRHIGRLNVAHRHQPTGSAEVRIPAQITGVRAYAVLGQPALDAQVPQIVLYRARERRRPSVQSRTLSVDTYGSPNASDTAWYVICPAWVLSPFASAASSRSA